MTDEVLKAMKRMMPGEEFECDRAFVTDDAVFARIAGIWTELRPLKATSPIETD